MATAPVKYGLDGKPLKYVEGLGWYNSAGKPEDPKSFINTNRLKEILGLRIKLDGGKVLDPLQQAQAGNFLIGSVKDAQTGKYIDYAVERTPENIPVTFVVSDGKIVDQSMLPKKDQEKVTVMSVGSALVSDPIGIAKDLIDTDNQFNPISDFFGGSPGTVSSTVDNMISIGVKLMFLFGIFFLIKRR